MGKAGQNNFTGISAQADIALLYLLESSKRKDFREIIIEGEKWEDFSLVFDNVVEHYEVKWHSRPISYASVNKIVAKEIIKDYGQNDVLKIIVKELGRDFKRDYEYLKSYYWLYLGDRTGYKKSPVINRFLKKSWTESSLSFLFRTEIIGIGNLDVIDRRILEYFALEDPFYLSDDDMESFIARSFKIIMEKWSNS